MISDCDMHIVIVEVMKTYQKHHTTRVESKVRCAKPRCHESDYKTVRSAMTFAPSTILVSTVFAHREASKRIPLF